VDYIVEVGAPATLERSFGAIKTRRYYINSWDSERASKDPAELLGGFATWMYCARSFDWQSVSGRGDELIH
jgi:hypothetical protein